MREEVLRALLYAKGNVAQHMRRVAGEVRDARDEMAEGAVSASALANRLSGAERDGEGFANAADEVRTAVAMMVPSLVAARTQIDEVGDESREAAASLLGLSASTSTASIAANAGSVSIGGFQASLAALTAVAAAAIAIMSALAVAFAGVAIAAAGVGAAFAALLGGGLMAMGQQAAAQQEDLKSTLEGVQHVLGQIKDVAAEIFAPLATEANAELFRGFASAALSVLENFVAMVNALRPALTAMADTLGGVFAETEPQFFAALEGLIREVLPYLTQFIAFLMRSVPKALRFLRDQVDYLLPKIAEFGRAMLDLAVPLLRIATAVGGVLIPVLTPVADFLAGMAQVIATVVVPPLRVLGNILGWLADTFGPVFKAVGAVVGVLASIGIALTAASWLTTLGGAALSLAGFLTSTLIPALYSVGTAIAAALGPVGWAAIAVGVIAGLLAKLGLLDDVLSGLANAILGVGGAINKSIGHLIPFKRQLAAIADAAAAAAAEVGRLTSIAGGALAGAAAGSVVPGLGTISGAVIGGIGGNVAYEAGAPAGGGGGGGSSRGQPAAGANRSRYAGTTVDLRGAQFGEDTSDREVERIVERAVEKADKRNRRRSGHSG
ncbi:hypothetical protein SAMN05216388_101790 [Halorientalis persicus]|uniref:Uncharacterized protein n=1 Tax=Halorientalis persicus TaxID=1367881 RepID=A0A1H8RZ85_9EURY|nr:hypothetical protein [Halorientalis persicus]SEO71690.1 hypothetical protein SAMN05216388_101790 [Halorientalis persicus]